MLVMRPAQGPEELEAVFCFRYDHFFRRFTAGYPGVDHHARRMFEPHDLESVHTCAFDEEGRLAAVSTATPADRPSIPAAWRSWFALDRLAPLGLDRTVVSTRLVLRPDVRHTGFYGLFHAHILTDYLRAGFRTALHYCRPDLIPRFERLGHRRYARPFDLPAGQFRTPMLLSFDDPEHLRRVGAPLWDLLGAGLTHADPAPLLAALPELTSRTNFQLLTQSQRLEYVLSRLGPGCVDKLPGGTPDALGRAACLDFLPGQCLMPTARDAFAALVLSGCVRAGTGARSSLLGPGTYLDPARLTDVPISVAAPGEMLVFEPALPSPGSVNPKEASACGTPSSTASAVS